VEQHNKATVSTGYQQLTQQMSTVEQQFESFCYNQRRVCVDLCENIATFSKTKEQVCD